MGGFTAFRRLLRPLLNGICCGRLPCASLQLLAVELQEFGELEPGIPAALHIRATVLEHDLLVIKCTNTDLYDLWDGLVDVCCGTACRNIW